MKRFLFNYILPPLLYFILYLWYLTLRHRNLSPEIEKIIRNQPGRYVLAFWHSRLFYLFFYFRNLKNFTVLVSPSHDGDLIARLCQLFGYKVVRGSSFKNTFGGSREMVKLLKKDLGVGIVADGSRGPRHKAQVGSMQLSRITGAPVFPITFDAHPKYEFKSWDRSVLPLPFSRCTVKFAPPIKLPSKADSLIIEQKQNELTEILCKITEECSV